MKKIVTTLFALIVCIGAFAAGHIASTTQTNISCHGLCDGTATGSVTGGVGPYGYSWTGPSSYTASGTNISSLCIGTYTLTVIDSSDMSTATATATITQPSILSITVGSPTICFGSFAVLTTSTTGGTSGYTYVWTPSTSLSSSTVSNPTSSPTITTTYTVVVTDAHGCTSTATSTVTVQPLPIVTVNSPTICAGGTATLTAPGATTYTWTAGATSTGVNTATATPMLTTTYTVTGSTGGCIGTAVSTVTVVPLPVVTVNSATICPGDTATLTPSGASIYSWSMGGGTPAKVTPITTTTYTVTGSTGGCTNTAVSTVTVTTSTISVNSPTICPGGTATLTAGGATTYAWSTGDLTNPITVTPATTTTYTVVGTTAGCTGTALSTVTVAPNPTIIVNSPTICAGGTAILTATGGMTYIWTAGAFGDPASVSPTTTTSYTVTGTSGVGCTGSAVATVTVASSAITVNSPTICTAGTATLIAGGGATSYTWSAGATSTGINTATAIPALTTTYTVTGTTGVCTGTAVSTVTVSSTPTITFTTSNPSCGACDGSVTPTISGGSPPYTFSWTGPTGGGASGGIIPITGACVGSFTVTVTSVDGCVATNSCTLTTGSVLSNSITSTLLSSCGACDGTATATTTGGSGSYTYLWNDPLHQTTATATGLCGGSYVVTVSDTVSGACSSAASTSIVSSTAPIIVLDSIKDKHCVGAALGAIYTHATAGTPPYTYLWSNGATTANITGLYAGTYTLTVTGGGSCSVSDSFTVNVHALHATYGTYTSANCTSNGSAEFFGAGSYPPFTYLWSDPLHQTTSNATNLPMGSYSCLITDSKGCNYDANTYVPSTCYNIIKGNVFNDLNGNCIKDAGELGIPGVILLIGTGYCGYTDVNGDYTIYTYTLSNLVTQILPPHAVQLCPIGSITANFTTFGDTITGANFADQFTASVNDLEVYFYPWTARPGFSQSSFLRYQNIGTTTISGAVVTLTMDSILTGFSSYPAASSYTYPTATWNVGTLIPGQFGYIYPYDSVPTIALGGYLGRVLHYTAHIDPVIGDATPPNNTDNESAIIVGSFDPNSKEVSPSGNLTAADSVLKYTIHFQNTGTDTAFTVVLKDTLSPYLDPATVKPGIASAPYTFNIAFDGVLTWTFNSIDLVDSTTNEAGSHGFATFTVKQKTDNMPGSIIKNTADIYFDFNPAIVTNTTANNIVGITTGIETSSTNNVVKVFPNPFNDVTTFEIKSKSNETYSFELTDVLGKTVRSITGITDKQFTVSRNGLENGVYFYKIYSSESIVGIGKLVIN
jgi:hypothetical protein